MGPGLPACFPQLEFLTCKVALEARRCPARGVVSTLGTGRWGRPALHAGLQLGLQGPRRADTVCLGAHLKPFQEATLIPGARWPAVTLSQSHFYSTLSTLSASPDPSPIPGGRSGPSPCWAPTGWGAGWRGVQLLEGSGCTLALAPPRARASRVVAEWLVCSGNVASGTAGSGLWALGCRSSLGLVTPELGPSNFPVTRSGFARLPVGTAQTRPRWRLEPPSPCVTETQRGVEAPHSRGHSHPSPWVQAHP